MADNDYIKELITKSHSDILFEKFISLLDDDDEIIYEPKGLFNRGILKDTGRISKLREGFINFEINRPGLYDVMPKGLFHDKLDDANNQEQFYDKIDKERKEIRRFFLPFDSTYYSAIANIEKENVKHFKNKFDSKIAFELLYFYRFLDEIDFLSLIEILFIDFFNHQKNYIDDSNIDDFILSFLPYETTYKDILVKMMDYCEDQSMLLRLLEVIPFAHEYTANWEKIEKILEYIVDINVSIESQKEYHKFTSDVPKNVLLDIDINQSNRSLVLGNTFFEEIEKITITFELSKYNNFIMNQFQTGSINKLLNLFISYFVPVHFDFIIKFKTSKISENDFEKKGFNLEQIDDESVKKITEIEKRVRNNRVITQGGSLWHEMVPPTDERMEFIDYLNLFYLLYLKDEGKHTFLSMNSKI